jgi:nitrate/nitrite-specific signal transduction histidine kinase
MGLRIMRHRAAVIGGEFSVARRPGGGTVVTCVFPNGKPRTRFAVSGVRARPA